MTDRYVPDVLHSPYDTKSDWVQVACGSYYTAAIDAAGDLYSWGKDGSTGRLGQGPGIGDRAIPHLAYDNNFVQISTGRMNTCARDSSDNLYCTGVDSAYSNGGIGSTDTLSFVAAGITVSTCRCIGYELDRNFWQSWSILSS
jgi:hypothetical protein